MKHLIIVLSTAALLGGCNSQTGQDWLDPLIVRNYEKRVELTNYLLRGSNFCDFGCDYICGIDPEPKIYKYLEEQNSKKFGALDARAKSGGLVLNLPKRPKIIIETIAPRQLIHEEIAPAKLVCIQKQGKHIEKIKTLLNKLATKDR